MVTAWRRRRFITPTHCSDSGGERVRTLVPKKKRKKKGWSDIYQCVFDLTIHRQDYKERQKPVSTVQTKDPSITQEHRTPNRLIKVIILELQVPLRHSRLTQTQRSKQSIMLNATAKDRAVRGVLY